MEEKRHYLTFSKDFKVNAVKIVLTGEKSMRQISDQISEELGISQNTLFPVILCNWKKEYLKDKEQSFPGKG